MKKILLILTLGIFGVSLAGRGGALGLQLGGITFGLGGSPSGGPIIGVGRSPDNGLAFAPVFVPGDRCDCQGCNRTSCCCH